MTFFSGLLRPILASFCIFTGLTAFDGHASHQDDAKTCEVVLSDLKRDKGLAKVFFGESSGTSILNYFFTLNRSMAKLEALATKPHGRPSEEIRQQLAIGHWFQIQVFPYLKNWQSNSILRDSEELESGILELADLEREELLRHLASSIPNGLAPLFTLAHMSGNSSIIEIGPADGLPLSVAGVGQVTKMYSNYAASKGWTLEILSSDLVKGEGRWVTLRLKGRDALSYMQLERGQHRFIQKGADGGSVGNRERTHTKFVYVKVYTEPTNQEFAFDEKDVTITFMRASGNGGQNVNKVESKVRAVHNPTGLVVAISNERSQDANKKIALEILKAKVFSRFGKQRKEELARVRQLAGQSEINERYVRTYDERHNGPQYHAVLNGELDEILTTRRFEILADRLAEHERWLDQLP